MFSLKVKFILVLTLSIAFLTLYFFSGKDSEPSFRAYPKHTWIRIGQCYSDCNKHKDDDCFQRCVDKKANHYIKPEYYKELDWYFKLHTFHVLERKDSIEVIYDYPIRKKKSDAKADDHYDEVFRANMVFLLLEAKPRKQDQEEQEWKCVGWTDKLNMKTKMTDKPLLLLAVWHRPLAEGYVYNIPSQSFYGNDRMDEEKESSDSKMKTFSILTYILSVLIIFITIMAILFVLCLLFFLILWLILK